MEGVFGEPVLQNSCCRLAALPTELHYEIEKYLPHDAIFCLQQTCQIFAATWRIQTGGLNITESQRLESVLQRQSFFRACRRKLEGPDMSDTSLRACSACMRLHTCSDFSVAQLGSSPFGRRCRNTLRRLDICEHQSMNLEVVRVMIDHLKATDTRLERSTCDSHALGQAKRNLHGLPTMLLWPSGVSTVWAFANCGRPSGISTLQSKPQLSIHVAFPLCSVDPTYFAGTDFEKGWTTLSRANLGLCEHCTTPDIAIKKALEYFCDEELLRRTMRKRCRYSCCTMEFELQRRPSENSQSADGLDGLLRDLGMPFTFTNHTIWIAVTKCRLQFPLTATDDAWLAASRPINEDVVISDVAGKMDCSLQRAVSQRVRYQMIAEALFKPSRKGRPRAGCAKR